MTHFSATHTMWRSVCLSISHRRRPVNLTACRASARHSRQQSGYVSSTSPSSCPLALAARRKLTSSAPAYNEARGRFKAGSGSDQGPGHQITIQSLLCWPHRDCGPVLGVQERIAIQYIVVAPLACGHARACTSARSVAVSQCSNQTCSACNDASHVHACIVVPDGGGCQIYWQ